MFSLIRHEPTPKDYLAARETFDQMFDNFFQSNWGLEPLGGVGLDMYQTDQDVVVKASLPGMKAEDVSISLTGDVLTIRGESKQKEESQKATYHMRELRYGSFSRSVTIPVPVSSNNAKAEFENGVLTLTLPKAEESKPKTITIKTK